MTGQSFLAILLVSLVNASNISSSNMSPIETQLQDSNYSGKEGEDAHNVDNRRTLFEFWRNANMNIKHNIRTVRHISSNYGNRRFCGHELVAKIRSVCILLRKQKRDAESNRSKRSVELDGLLFEDNIGAGKPVVRFRTAKALRILTKRGASEDCCANSCSLNHLKSFCL